MKSPALKGLDTKLSKTAFLEMLETYVTQIARSVAEETVSRALDGYEESPVVHEDETPRSRSGIAPSSKAKSGRTRLSLGLAKVGVQAIAKSGNSFLPVVITGIYDLRGVRLFELDRLDKDRIPKGVKSRLNDKPLSALYMYDEKDIYYPPKPGRVEQEKKADRRVHQLSSAGRR